METRLPPTMSVTLNVGVDASLPVTGPAVIVPVGTSAFFATKKLVAGMLDARVRVTVFELAVVGVPDMGMVTTVLLVLIAVPAVNPAGRPETVKLDAVIDVAYVALVNVYRTLAPLTACPTLRFDNPVAVTANVTGVTVTLYVPLTFELE